MYKEALTEMNGIVGFSNDGKPLVVTKEMTEEFCKDLIIKAIPSLLATDYFSKATNEVLKEFGWDREKIKAPAVEVIDEDPEKLPEISLKDFVGDAESLKELKEIATSEPDFKSIRGKLASYKNADDLRLDMLTLLDTPINIPEKLHQKLEAEPVREPIKVVETSYQGIKNVNEIHTRPPFSTLFNVNKQTLKAITASMVKNGYDSAYPIVLWKDIVIDGHTRLQAAILADIEKIPVEVKEFANEKKALNYAIHNQRDRRNLSDAELLKCIAIVDNPMSKIDAGAKGGKKEEEKIEPTHKVTAKILGIGESVVTDARTVLADEKAKEAVETGKKSIRRAAKQVREKKQATKEKKVKEAARVLTPVETVVKVLRANAGNEIAVVTIVESSDAMMPESNLELMEGVVNTVLEVLLAIGIVKLVTDDVIFIKKTL